MSARPKFYVTTPIYYVNDEPHIGHVYTTIVADVIARYRRATGHDVYFLTGTDEHGQKIERAAQAQGLEPTQLADRVVTRYHELWKQLEISHDDCSRARSSSRPVAAHGFQPDCSSCGSGASLQQIHGQYPTGCRPDAPDKQPLSKGQSA